MLTKLDVSQRALLDQVRAQRAEVLVSTEPADRPAAEAARAHGGGGNGAVPGIQRSAGRTGVREAAVPDTPGRRRHP